MNLIDFISQSDLVKDWQKGLEKNTRQLITGISGSAKMLLIVSAYRQKQKQTVVVTPNLYYANQLTEDLCKTIDLS